MNYFPVFRPPGISSAALHVKEVEYSYVNILVHYELLEGWNFEQVFSPCVLAAGSQWYFLNEWTNEWMNDGTSRNWLPTPISSFCHGFLFPNRIWFCSTLQPPLQHWGCGEGGEVAGRCWLVPALRSGPTPPAMGLTRVIAIRTSLLQSPEEGSRGEREGCEETAPPLSLVMAVCAVSAPRTLWREENQPAGDRWRWACSPMEQEGWVGYWGWFTVICIPGTPYVPSP